MFLAICGNGKIDSGESCDGGIGCTQCTCNPDYFPTSPVTIDCESNSWIMTNIIRCHIWNSICRWLDWKPWSVLPLTGIHQLQSCGLQHGALLEACQRHCWGLRSWNYNWHIVKEVSFVVRGPTQGWVAIGFTSGGYRMVGSDAVLGYTDNAGESHVLSFYVTTYQIRWLPTTLHHKTSVVYSLTLSCLLVALEAKRPMVLPPCFSPGVSLVATTLLILLMWLLFFLIMWENLWLSINARVEAQYVPWRFWYSWKW